MDEGPDETWREAGEEFDVLDLTIDPVVVPREREREREREPAPLRSYALRAPQTAAPTAITVRDVQAVALGAAIVAVLLALTGWFTQDAR